MTNTTPNSTTNQATCVLPHPDVQRFLLDLIDESTFKGQMSEFVASVKQVLRTAEVLNQP